MKSPFEAPASAKNIMCIKALLNLASSEVDGGEVVLGSFWLDDFETKVDQLGFRVGMFVVKNSRIVPLKFENVIYGIELFYQRMNILSVCVKLSRLSFESFPFGDFAII